MFDSDTYRSTKSQLIISSLVVLFAIGLYATPDAFGEHSMNATVENAAGSSTPGCEPDCFLPSTVTIAAGGMVTFANNDSAAHTSTSGSGADGPSGVWDSSLVMMNSAYTTPALDVGEYPYFCMVHPWMEGLVIVTNDHGASTSEPESEPESEPAPTTTSSSTNTVESAQGSSTPGCEPNCFIPATITINPGESITFVNNDTAAHTHTPERVAGVLAFIDTGLMMAGDSITVSVTEIEGVYPYFCMVHPWMTGTVIVGEGSATPSQAESSQAQDEAAERITAAEAAAQAAEQAAKTAEAEASARIAEAEAAARIAEAEAATKAAEEAAQAAEQASQDRIEAAAVNEKIEISMDFTNDSDVQQSFALIVQIKDSNDTTISLSHVTGMLGAGQTLDQVLSYTPTEAGTYTVEKFLWNNFADPTALTDSKETFSLTVS
jgi:plastocyanin